MQTIQKNLLKTDFKKLTIVLLYSVQMYKQRQAYFKQGLPLYFHSYYLAHFEQGPLPLACAAERVVALAFLPAQLAL